MGACYSHMVFFPPEDPTYHVNNRTVTFYRQRDGICHEHDLVARPLTMLTTSLKSSIPFVFLSYPSATYTILFSHGNAEDLGMVLPYAEELGHILHANVAVYDYSGYGYASGPSPSERAFYADIRAAYTHLTTTLAIPPSRIVLFGRSLGSGPTVDLAASADHPVRAVVLISPIASCVRVVWDTKRVTLPVDMFANVDKVRRVGCKVLVVHGTGDDVVPVWHGERVWERAAKATAPLWVEGADHNTLETDVRPEWKVQVFERYREFLEELAEEDGL